MEGICETLELRVGDTSWWECVTRTGVFEKALCKRNETTTPAKMSAMNEEIQHRQYEDLDSLLIVPREKWTFNVTINTHCKWSQLHYITKTLQQKGEYDPVKRTCFGMLLDVYPQGYFCVGLLHSIMICRITERQSMDHELWFAIGKSKARLSKQEFCLITELKFGPMLDVFRQPYEVAADGIHSRYWNGQDSVKLQALLDPFLGSNFQRPGDATKMALVLIANNVLFGQDYRRWVTPWLLSLVEDIDAWNVFPLGHYIWKLTLDYLLKRFEVPDLSVTKETRLRYNIYRFAWAMEAIPALQKIVAPSDPKDNVHPRMCRWDCNKKSKDFYKTIQKLESSDQLWALETLELTADEALLEYFVDLDVPLSESNEYLPIGHMEDRSDWGLGARQKKRSLKEKRASSGTKRMRTATALVDEMMDEGDDHGQGSEQSLDHGLAAPEPPTDPPQMQSGNDPSFTEARTSPQAPIDLVQPHIANEPAFTEVTTGPEAPIGSTLPQTVNEPAGGPSDGAGLEHDDADDGQHHEPGVDVDIDDDVLGADGEHVTHVDDVVEEAVAVVVTLYNRSYRFLSWSTPNAIEIRSLSPESSVVHHGTAEILDPTEWARLKMASKYMASPFVDPLVTRRDVRDKIVEDYEAFKKEESARRNVSILGDQGADFFITLEDPNEEMTSEHIDACLNLLCKRMTGPKSKLYTTRGCMVDTIFFVNTIRMLHIEFSTEDARAKMQISDELRGYAEGKRPTYTKKWEDVDFILAPCNVGGHWVVAKIDLVRWTIKVVDSAITSDAKDNGVHASQMTPLTTLMPFICHQVGYFNNIRRKRRDLMPMPLDIHLSKAKVHLQNDSVSCGMFMIRYIEHIL
ncbi:Uncharacterized protein TCM_014994 [Theobroma cacao]|uniref:Ubiquitin-like protease family profile domain-containing protein n=1 Tax=Theobroma cacao TaxID=3641 RepID=A0A061G0P8_THECC|nr:Uncharacterized protein TCM_014994 [Theobroma cacao]